MNQKFAVLALAAVLLTSGAAAQVDLNIDLNLFGGSDDAPDQQAQPDQQSQTDQQEPQTQPEQESDSAIDRDHSGRDVEDEPITSQESDSGSGGVMGSISGFVSSLFG